MSASVYDVVVIGSGAFGASVGFHIAKSGRSVAILDKAEIASQTSSRAAGLSGQLRSTEIMTRLAVRSVEKFERFTEETGQPLEFFQPGSVSVARRPEDLARLRARVEMAAKFGLDVSLIDPNEAHQLNPLLQTKGMLGATHSRRDIYLEPVQIPRGYAAAAQELGAILASNTMVQEIAIKDGTVEKVVTDRGDFPAKVVVDAAGGWARLVASLAGADLPIVPMRHQLMITVPLKEVNNDQPATRILDANVYVRPSRGGLMLGGYERQPLAYDPRAQARGFRVEDVELDLEILRKLASTVEDQFPVFRNVAIQEHRGGLPTMTADGNHVFGAYPGIGGLYVLGGCNVAGLAISPALGEELAKLILTGRTEYNLSHLSPKRFIGRLNEADLREAARWQYASMYAVPEGESPTVPSRSGDAR